MSSSGLSRRQSIAIIALCVAMFALGQFHRSSGAVFAPILIDRFALSATMTGALVSSMFLATIAAQTPLGAALDRFGLRPVLLLNIIVVGAGALIFAFADSYETALAGRIVIGVGAASMGAASYVIYARAFPPRDFGYVNGLVVGLGGVGGLTGTFPLAYALERLPYSAVMAAPGVIAFAMAVAAFFILSDRRFQRQASGGDSRAEGYLALLKRVEFIRILALAAVTFAPIVTFTGVWGGPYFRDVYGLSPEAMGAILFLMSAATILGAFAFAWAERRGFPRRRLILASVGLSLACFAILAVVPFDGPTVPAALLSVMIFGQQFYIPLGAHMRRIAPDASMARASTLLLFVSVAAIPVMQTGFGAILDIAVAAGVSPVIGYRIGFASIGGLIALAAAIYAGAQDVDECAQPT